MPPSPSRDVSGSATPSSWSSESAADSRRVAACRSGLYRWGKVGYSGPKWTMLLGEHEHALDEKNRLTLPSKLRGAFGDGVVVTRGLDGCLFAWPVEAWEAMAERLEAVDPLSADGRRI